MCCRAALHHLAPRSPTSLRVFGCVLRCGGRRAVRVVCVCVARVLSLCVSLGTRSFAGHTEPRPSHPAIHSLARTDGPKPSPASHFIRPPSRSVSQSVRLSSRPRLHAPPRASASRPPTRPSAFVQLLTELAPEGSRRSRPTRTDEQAGRQADDGRRTRTHTRTAHAHALHCTRPARRPALSVQRITFPGLTPGQPPSQRGAPRFSCGLACSGPATQPARPPASHPCSEARPSPVRRLPSERASKSAGPSSACLCVPSACPRVVSQSPVSLPRPRPSPRP